MKLRLNKKSKLIILLLICIILNVPNILSKDKIKPPLTEIQKVALTIKDLKSVKKSDNKISNPIAPKGYKLELVGSDRIQVVNNKGEITKPLVDSEVNLYYVLTNLKTNKKTDVPNKNITIPGKFSVDPTNNLCPPVIPTLREWLGSKGLLTLNPIGKIVIDKNYSQDLNSVLENFPKDILFFTKKLYKIELGSSEKSHIFITLNCQDKSLGKEGYFLKITDRITLEANTSQGILMGTKTILQLINIYGLKIPKGIIRDYPKYKRRGFVLDAGRKFFTMKFLRDYVKIMSYYKMNEFHIHLNDNGFKQFFDNDWDKTYSAFRLESDVYPGLTAKDGFYTKKEFKDLQKLGMKYGVNIIPEIDIPAHCLAFTKYRPSLGSKEFGMDHLDITKKETYTFFDKLFDEYLGGDNPVFIGSDVHIGTDEYSKKMAEEFRAFTDHYLKLVQSYGKTARLWGALTHAKGKTFVTSKNVIMNAWYNGYADPHEMIEQGYELISTSDRHLYIVPAAGYYYNYLNLKFLYNKWEPNLIGGDVFPLGHPKVSGGAFAVWNDHCGNGISEKDVHHRAFPALQVMAEKMWEGYNPKLKFKGFEKKTKNLIEAPYINIMAIVKSATKEVAKYNFKNSKTKDLSLNGYNIVSSDNVECVKNEGYIFKNKSSVVTPIEEIGYPYKVSFSVTFDKSKFKEGILFSSLNAKVVVIESGTDKIQLGFKRDGYFYKFSYKIEKNKIVNISIEGTSKGTTLFVNGKQVEKLQGKVIEGKNEKGKISKMYIQQTLVFPLKTIGDSENSFSGVLHSLSVNKL